MQLMKKFICSNLVAAFWADPSGNLSKDQLHISLIDYIIVVFILILKGIDFYEEIKVEAKFPWLNFYAKFCFQWFS